METKLKKILTKLAVSIDTPRSLSVCILARYGAWTEILDLTFDPGNYLSYQQEKAAHDYQITSLVKKCPSLPTGIDTRLAAMKSAVSAEVQCSKTNTRLYSELTTLDNDTFKFLERARKIVAYCLGKAPSIDEICLNARFGPGTSSSAKKATHIYGKQLSRRDVTPKALPYALRLLKVRPELFGYTLPDVYLNTDVRERFTLLEYNTWDCVPKTAVTDRPICIEPHINMALQLGVGSIIRSKLKKLNIDLDNQFEVNRLLAKNALNWDLATIDFRSASDTISISFVKMLLPESWFQVLNDLRCHVTSYDDVKHINHKFSSMGNGFTFELETLLFHALALAVSRSKLTSTFGDDVIIPKECVSDFIRVAEFCGLSINTKKSFTNGLFYESCGVDFFNGLNIRPYFFKKDNINDESLYALANGLRHAGSRWCNYLGCDSVVASAWRYTIDCIHGPVHCGPACHGDTVIWANPGDHPKLVFWTNQGGLYTGKALVRQQTPIFWEYNKYRHIKKWGTTFAVSSISYKVPKRYERTWLTGYLLTRRVVNFLPDDDNIVETSFASKTRSREKIYKAVARYAEIRHDAMSFI